ncbi:MAG TPA: radical SAM protein [Desulfosporosinus sp.]|nr:radical SAM protein [Desulfosporosinus sp.]
MHRPIYTPKGRAGEYADFALNIYNSCNHNCWYCYAKKNFQRWHPNETFGEDVKPREGIVEATKLQLSKGKYRDKKIMLCFMCDPYPHTIDTTATREVIQAIKEAGAHVQILTKGGDLARRDFDLLDDGDSFGITLSCLYGSNRAEPNAAEPLERLNSLIDASRKGINTWVSFEPVIEPIGVLELIYNLPVMVSKDTLLKIGKLNHYKTDIDWRKFGLEAERICKENGWNYYIKEDLRAEMEG